MDLHDWFKFSERPANLPANAPRFWPIVEVVSFVGLLSKPLILVNIGFVWWAALTFGLSIEIGAIIGTIVYVALLIAFIPSILRVYWDTQILYIEEQRIGAERRAKRREAPQNRTAKTA